MFLILYPAFVYFPDTNTLLISRILDNKRFYPFFEGYIKAINSIHIRIHIPNTDQAQYRNRKGYLSQNILAAYNFDLNFIYVLLG
jgi:hypothetical protein